MLLLLFFYFSFCVRSECNVVSLFQEKRKLVKITYTYCLVPSSVLLAYTAKHAYTQRRSSTDAYVLDVGGKNRIDCPLASHFLHFCSILVQLDFHSLALAHSRGFIGLVAIFCAYILLVVSNFYFFIRIIRFSFGSIANVYWHWVVHHLYSALVPLAPNDSAILVEIYQKRNMEFSEKQNAI